MQKGVPSTGKSQAANKAGCLKPSVPSIQRNTTVPQTSVSAWLSDWTRNAGQRRVLTSYSIVQSWESLFDGEPIVLPANTVAQTTAISKMFQTTWGLEGEEIAANDIVDRAKAVLQTLQHDVRVRASCVVS